MEIVKNVKKMSKERALLMLLGILIATPIAVVLFACTAAFDIALACVAVMIFDVMMGTSFFCPQVVGIVALVTWTAGRIARIINGGKWLEI